jgi:hypothetical protein
MAGIVLSEICFVAQMYWIISTSFFFLSFNDSYFGNYVFKICLHPNVRLFLNSTVIDPFKSLARRVGVVLVSMEHRPLKHDLFSLYAR